MKVSQLRTDDSKSNSSSLRSASHTHIFILTSLVRWPNSKKWTIKTRNWCGVLVKQLCVTIMHVRRFKIGLASSVTLIILELANFMYGITMSTPFVCLICILFVINITTAASKRFFGALLAGTSRVVTQPRKFCEFGVCFNVHCKSF